MDEMQPKDSHMMMLIQALLDSIPMHERQALFRTTSEFIGGNTAAVVSMADRVSFICYSRAAPQGSKRHIGGGVLIESSKRVKPFRSDLQGVAIEATPVDWGPWVGVSRLRVDFHFRRPKSHLTSKGALTKAAPLFPTGRQIGDTDKLIRSVCDALTGVTWYDDSQVVDITAKKRFFERDQTIITITPVNV